MLQVFDTKNSENNAILLALSREDTLHIRRNARKLLLEPGQALYRAGEAVHYVYFPTTCVVSHSYTTPDGVSASMALTGNDGIIGLAALLNAHSALHGAVVQISGYALKVAAPIVQAEFARAGLLQRAILRYMHVFITQLAQNSACNRLHSLEKRLCRCLLLCQDRIQRDEMFITQESMASMIGAQRESVTLAAGRLQDQGIIRYARGRVQILDRYALETRSCECYASLIDECTRLAPPSAVGGMVNAQEHFRVSL